MHRCAEFVTNSQENIEEFLDILDGLLFQLIVLVIRISCNRFGLIALDKTKKMFNNCNFLFPQHFVDLTFI